MKARLSVPAWVVERTLAFLRRTGDRRAEGLVLWLGRRDSGAIVVVEAYVPDQECGPGFFRIPPVAMSDLLGHLRGTGTFIAAQVHSHPRDAFHSDADDRYAIVRHLGALSLVVPRFGRDTMVRNFLIRVAAFRLTAANVWEEISATERGRSITIT